MVTPDTSYGYHPADRSLEVLKVREVPSGYDAPEYESERLTITARDGAQVPVSIVYAMRFPWVVSGQLFLSCFSAYVLSFPPPFSTFLIFFSSFFFFFFLFFFFSFFSFF